MIVNVPIVDLWKNPNSKERESQLLYGEPVEVVSENGDWVYVRALDQQNYPGWIERKFLYPTILKCNLVVRSFTANIPFQISLGTRLEGVKELENEWVVKHVDGKEGTVNKNDVWKIGEEPEDFPSSVVEHGRQMIGSPYLWGGRCSLNPDCSGFVNLLYRIHGRNIPRDSHDQFLKATPCEYDDLLPGDLIFSASESKPERITHVMMYSGDGRILEATSASGNVREVPAEVRFNCPLSAIQSGSVYNKYVVHLGKMV